MPNKVELIVDAAKLIAETSAGEAVIKAGVKVLSETVPAATEAASAKLEPSFEKLIAEAWQTSPFKQAASHISQEAASAQAAKTVGVGSSWSQLRVAKDTRFGELPPIANALVKSDSELYAQPTFSNQAPAFSVDKLAKATGVDKRILRLDEKSGRIQVLLSEPSIASAHPNTEFVLPDRHPFGVLDGSLTGRRAIDAIWNRYVPRPTSLTFDPFPEGQYSSSQLRKIEKHFGLPDQSFQYRDSELVYTNSELFKRQSLHREHFAPILPPQTALPYAAELTRGAEIQDINFSLNGSNFHLEPRSEHKTDWRYSKGWKSSTPYLTSDFKLRAIADNGADLGRIHDIFLPRLHEDMEFRSLLTNWKIINPAFRARSGMLTGQDSKALTLYPAGDDKLLRLHDKLEEIIFDKAPDLVLPAPPISKTVDRLIGKTNRIAVAREQFPSNSEGLVPLNPRATFYFDADKDLGPFSKKSRLSALEELTGIEPGSLSFNQEGKLAVQGKLKTPDRAYVGKGHSERRSRSERGYTQRWAMHMVGGRYNVDPIIIRKLWSF